MTPTLPPPSIDPLAPATTHHYLREVWMCYCGQVFHEKMFFTFHLMMGGCRMMQWRSWG